MSVPRRQDDPDLGLMSQVRPDDARVLRVIGSEPETYAGATYWNCNILRYAGREYVFSHRAILTVVVMSACNAACKFCSNEITFTPSGPYLRYDRRLARVKDFALLAGVTKVAFTGGEPTLHQQRLYELVSAMAPGFRKTRLHTNGYGLLRDIDAGGRTKTLLAGLIDVGLTGVSVSVAHHETKANETVMRFRNWPGMTDDGLREIAGYASDRFTPRLSCVMTHEGVNSVPDLLDYMRWGRSLGYRKFIFRTCSEIPEEFRKPTEYSTYNADNYLSIDRISEILDRSGDFERVYRQRKSDSKVDVYRWNDITFDVDESSEEPDPDQKIRRINVMPNGIAHTSWIDPLSVLFEDDRERAELAMRREFRIVESK